MITAKINKLFIIFKVFDDKSVVNVGKNHPNFSEIEEPNTELIHTLEFSGLKYIRNNFTELNYLDKAVAISLKSSSEISDRFITV